MSILLHLAVALLVYTVTCTIYQVLFSPLRTVPGPFFARWTRLWELFEVCQGHFEKTNIELHKRYGSIVRISPYTYSINDPGAIRQIYGAGSAFTKHSFYYAFGNPDKIHADLFSEMDNGRHAIKRRKVASLYSMSSLVNYEAAIDEINSELCEKMSLFATIGTPFQFPAWMQFYAFDVIGKITVGESFGFLQAGSDCNGILGAIHESMVYGGRLGIFAELHWIMAKIARTLRIPIPFDLVSNYITGKIKAKTSTLSLSDKPDTDFLSQLLIRFDSGKLNYADVFNSIGANIAAGSDTTAISLSAIFYHLLKNPEKLQKLEDEIDTVMLGRPTSDSVTYRESQQMIYLQACIKEALRLHPATGYPLLRVVPRGGVMLAGKFFPQGTVVGVNPWVSQQSEKIFGPDPASFQPERWLEDKDRVSIMEANFLSFGAGARTCIGKNISLLEMSKVIPCLLSKFHFQLEQSEQPWETSTTWFVKQKFRCQVTLRQTKSSSRAKETQG
ncbi:Cystathionine beta-synthase core [Penicillium atrosanguineum]|uniref:Cystathionine beta-synthase core n=1 Tax=Penicillium atrosanguineum TaxID=1132637 RepID=UPI002390E83B|nr:Cystathionine beta-synthase core [Penicillium atrosanguineum]KAJ5305480.1 Cystathionine beta-synthase core [Penicillium atrosanguineum]